MKAKVNWTEKDFENWFCKTPTLPSGECVMVIAGHTPVKRMVDLVALDSEGGLVLLEVKNETATRAAVGQSLEYLAQYADTLVEDLEDDFRTWKNTDGSLAEAYEAFFQHPLSLSARRRVFLVAPQFDTASSMAAEYLTKLFAHVQVSYHLVEARDVGGMQFEISLYQPPIRPPKDLHGFVANARGRIFYVVEPGPTPILWNIGRRMESGELRRTAGKALSRRALRLARGSMILLAPELPEVDLTLTDTTWYRPPNPGKPTIGARVIGSVTVKGVKHVVMARFRDGTWHRFLQLQASTFSERFVQADLDLPNWKAILSQVQQQANLITPGDQIDPLH